jgi:predicted transcriptional regulator of viral defense system
MARLSEFQRLGITAAAIARLERDGVIVRLARGLYQLPDAVIETQHTLAEAAKLVPKGIICLTSALAYHELTDQIPPYVWMAIGPKDWRPRAKYPPLRFARFPQTQLHRGVEEHRVEKVPVRVFNIAKTVSDLFRYRQTVGINVALEGLREALRQQKVTPAEIAKYAVEGGAWKVVEPYMTALTSNA